MHLVLAACASRTGDLGVRRRNMQILELPGWRIEYDRVATAAAYACAPVNGPEACGCGPCRNWAATRARLLPEAFRALLDRLGIPLDREAEVYHNARLESGLHSYGGWYHFVGRVLFGERECSPHVAVGPLAVYFHSQPAMLPEAFARQPVVQLEIDAEVPWLSEIPEAD
jgi:hypothetical protein